MSSKSDIVLSDIKRTIKCMQDELTNSESLDDIRGAAMLRVVLEMIEATEDKYDELYQQIYGGEITEPDDPDDPDDFGPN